MQNEEDLQEVVVVHTNENEPNDIVSEVNLWQGLPTFATHALFIEQVSMHVTISKVLQIPLDKTNFGFFRIGIKVGNTEFSNNNHLNGAGVPHPWFRGCTGKKGCCGSKADPDVPADT